MEVTIENITNSINQYLKIELEKDLQKEVSQMNKPNEKKIANKREKLAPHFEYATFISDFFSSVAFMREQNLSLATHTSKGVHPSVKGNNIIFLEKRNDLSHHIIGSHSINHIVIDANSNNTGSHAGHLKTIVGFLNIRINGKLFYEFIKEKSLAFQKFFEKYDNSLMFDYLSSKINNIVVTPSTDERNKQLLFPVDTNNYVCIIPLYPSSLANYVYEQINFSKYSEDSKSSRESKKNNRHDKPFRDFINLASVKLGGNNQQNVSRLNNEQGGRNYLLPSLPPPSISRNIDDNEGFRPSKFATSIFSKSLKYQCQKDIQRVFEVVEDTRNIVEVRDKRKNALDVVLQTLFSFAEYMRTALPAGWSKDYKELSMAEKYWLDPMRAELKGEEEFAEQRDSAEWIDEIINNFASWLNALLREQFPQHKNDIADAEFIEWEREIEDMKKQYQRAGKGVFL